MISPNGVIALVVILTVLICFLVYYHFICAYQINSDIYQTVKSSVQGLWSDRILPANNTYFSTRLSDTIKALDSYNDIVSPIIDQSIQTIAQNEQSCGWMSNIWVMSVESGVIIAIIILLILQL